MEHAPQDVGIGHRPADPLQREELKAAFQDVGVERRELVGADIERDADARRFCWITDDCSRLNSRFETFSVRENRGAGPSPSGSA